MSHLIGNIALFPNLTYGAPDSPAIEETINQIEKLEQ